MKEFLKKAIFYEKLPASIQEKIAFIGNKLFTTKRTARCNFAVANISLQDIELAVYFDGGLGLLYQIEQWFNQLEILDENKKILIVTRILPTYNWLLKNTKFIIVHCRTMDDLIGFYDENNLKTILYVNHSQSNFQSLINGKALHVHINHGESDKTSTITHQSQAYDYVFISAQAAYDKYNLNLIKKDMNKFIKVGRPQVDNVQQIEPFDTNKKVILYAPTWEGTHESMNFSSLIEYGLSMVEQIVNSNEYFLVYKPHPNSGSRNKKLFNINEEIQNILNDSSNSEVILDGDINSLYPHIDIAIFDNSAVAIDYLIVDKPMIMTDLFYKIEGRLDKPTITGATKMITADDSKDILNIIKNELINDTVKIKRDEISKYFLGEYDYSKCESTELFIKKVLEVSDERDVLIKELDKL
ncbi:MAG: CDP-glycerol glycerophosphotransferase family protein [Campylobacterota bacterium]|nr:CDP-glycerol glycerophosphotransferase family protein [Campylobacterota bacterium]